MRPATVLIPTIALLLNAACASRTPTDAANGDAALINEAEDEVAPKERWQLRPSEGGVTLTLGPSSDPRLRIFCASENRKMLLNVPKFRPVGSEERMTFGSGGTVTTLVADPSGDEQHGGVSATAPLPLNLVALLAGPVGINYGSQDLRAVAPPGAAMVDAFVEACNDDTSGEGVPEPPAPAKEPATSACLMQGPTRLPANRLKAVGTEPFWSATIEGRCVTYTTPENQTGTRVWAAFSGSRDAGTWTGYYGRQRFVLRTSPQPDCSDGMSDRRYPLSVALTVSGETRRGCAAPPQSPIWGSEGDR